MYFVYILTKLIINLFPIYMQSPSFLKLVGRTLLSLNHRTQHHPRTHLNQYSMKEPGTTQIDHQCQLPLLHYMTWRQSPTATNNNSTLYLIWITMELLLTHQRGPLLGLTIIRYRVEATPTNTTTTNINSSCMTTSSDSSCMTTSSNSRKSTTIVINTITYVWPHYPFTLQIIKE